MELRKIAASILSFAPERVLRRIARTNVLPVYFHGAGKVQPPHIRHLYSCKGEVELERDLDQLLKRYQPLTLQQYVASLVSDVPLGKPAMLLTIDDGLSQVTDVVAPILLRKGVPAVLFVCSALAENRTMPHDHVVSLIVERILRGPTSQAFSSMIEHVSGVQNLCSEALLARLLPLHKPHHPIMEKLSRLLEINVGEYLQREHPYLGKGELQSLQRMGFTVGAHSIDHPHYGDLSLGEQLRQTLDSAAWVRDQLQSPIVAFAFPYGDARVSREFFTSLWHAGIVQVSFGTDGLGDSGIYRHVQRMSLEDPPWPTRTLVAWQLARRFVSCMRR